MTRQHESADVWRDSSLAGRRIVNTRSRRQAPVLDDRLAERGAVPVPYPCIEIVPPEDASPLESAIGALTEQAFDWVVFMSANAVQAVFDIASRNGTSSPFIDERIARVAVVGPGTAEAVRRLLHLPIAVEAPVQTAEALAGELIARGACRALIPAAERARETLPRLLAAAGVDTTVVTAYRTVLGTGGADVPQLLFRGKIDAVVFTSPSTVEGLAARFADEGGDWSLLASVCVICIGPVTADAARARRLRVSVEPRVHTVDGLLEDLNTYFAGLVDDGQEGDTRHG